MSQFSAIAEAYYKGIAGQDGGILSFEQGWVLWPAVSGQEIIRAMQVASEAHRLDQSERWASGRICADWEPTR